MPSTRRTRSVSRGTTRRKFVWVRHHVEATTTGQTFGSDLLSQFETDYGAQLIGCTIVRIRGTMFVSAASGQGTTNTFRMAARVASGQGLDLSVAIPAVADLYQDENADWMLWEPFAHVIPATSASSYPMDGNGMAARVIDVRSSRRIGELGERLIMLATPNPAAPTIVWAYGWDLSIGVKLP